MPCSVPERSLVLQNDFGRQYFIYTFTLLYVLMVLSAVYTASTFYQYCVTYYF